MIHRVTYLCCAIALYYALAARPIHAEAIHFNTDTGVMTIDGNATTSFFGVSVQTSVVEGMQQFRFRGGVAFIPTDVVTASGSRPLSLWAGNDIFVDAGAVFNFDASGTTGKLGGGNGGAGGAGGNRFDCNPFGCGTYESGDFGSMGSNGSLGTNGVSGGTGTTGSSGTGGFNNAGGAGVAGAGGAGGGGGARGDTAGAGGRDSE
jgi:hypothetical protein